MLMGRSKLLGSLKAAESFSNQGYSLHAHAYTLQPLRDLMAVGIICVAYKGGCTAFLAPPGKRIFFWSVPLVSSFHFSSRK